MINVGIYIIIHDSHNYKYVTLFMTISLYMVIVELKKIAYLDE